MKRIGFLSFGHWTASPQSQTQSAADTLLQSIDLAVEAERLGTDGAYFRVHHFARQLASPFPLLAAVGVKTRKIEIGTAVIDMRYENPHYMAEDADSADLIAGGRLELGISRGSSEQVIDGWRYFGYQPKEGESDADMGRRHAEEFIEAGSFPSFAFQSCVCSIHCVARNGAMRNDSPRGRMSITKSKVTASSFNPVEYLDIPAVFAAFLAEALESGDAVVADSLGVIARACGVSEIAPELSVSRESLYLLFST